MFLYYLIMQYKNLTFPTNVAVNQLVMMSAWQISYDKYLLRAILQWYASKM